MKQDIKKIDPNFLSASVLAEKYEWYDIESSPIVVSGLAVHGEGVYQRMPEETAAKVSDSVHDLNWHTAGGSVRFKTDSDEIAVRVESRFDVLMSHMPLTGSSGVDVYMNGRFEGAIRPEDGKAGWFEGMLPNPYGLAEFELNLPLYNGICHMLIGIRKGALLEAPKAYTYEKPIVYYGSSITQGGCASRPGNSYQGHLTRWLDAEQYNLGFSGSARGEMAMAEYIAGLEMTAFVMDYDHNVRSAAELKEHHAPFFKKIREAHPDLPILLVTRPDQDKTEYKVYWEENFTQKSRDVIYETYQEAVASGDDKVRFLDGYDLYGDKDRDACSVDGCHPNDLGFYRMAEAMYPILKEMLK